MRILKRITLSIVLCILLWALGSTAMAAEVYSRYTVQAGDSIYTIAKANGLSMDAIYNANGLRQGIKIYPKAVLILDSNAKNNPNANYTVASGDTLYKLAGNYGTTVQTLKEDNKLSSDRIYKGQKLLVRQAPAPPPDSTLNPQKLTDEEIYMMAKMIYGEARGEAYIGQVAVGAVIMNRLKSDSFPDTMAAVLFQKSQFTAVSDGQYYLTPDATALKAAREAADGMDPTYGALFYWNPVKAPNNKFLNAKPILVVIGNHVFAK